MSKQTMPLGMCSAYVGIATSTEVFISMPWLFLNARGLTTYTATSTTLSRVAHPLFSRTVPSDFWQGSGIGNTISAFAWTQIVVIYADNTYGAALQTALVLDPTVSAHVVGSVPWSGSPSQAGVASEQQISQLFDEIAMLGAKIGEPPETFCLNKKKACAFVLATMGQDSKRILNHARRRGYQNGNAWIGAEAVMNFLTGQIRTAGEPDLVELNADEASLFGDLGTAAGFGGFLTEGGGTIDPWIPFDENGNVEGGWGVATSFGEGNPAIAANGADGRGDRAGSLQPSWLLPNNEYKVTNADDGLASPLSLEQVSLAILSLLYLPSSHSILFHVVSPRLTSSHLISSHLI